LRIDDSENSSLSNSPIQLPSGPLSPLEKAVETQPVFRVQFLPSVFYVCNLNGGKRTLKTVKESPLGPPLWDSSLPVSKLLGIFLQNCLSGLMSLII
jgi:hypothetical protein